MNLSMVDQVVYLHRSMLLDIHDAGPYKWLVWQSAALVGRRDWTNRIKNNGPFTRLISERIFFKI